MSNNFESAVLKTIRYFSFFKYPPNFEEIYTFLKKKSSKKRLASILERMVRNKVILRSENGNLYTLPQYSINQSQSSNLKTQNYNPKLKTINNLAIKQFNNWKKKYVISHQKLNNLRFCLYIELLSWFPQIQLVGFSGTVAMMNADEKDDIDLFIITAKNRLFTARIITILLAQVMDIRRKRLTYSRRPSRIGYKDKVCLNLFFDESNLRVPRFKQTEYVAHEVLQMKPLINKNNTYEKFLHKKKWVYEIFPNATKIKIQKSTRNNVNFLGNILEFCLKKLQLISIKQHQTNEMVTNTQLWFFPEDFEKKVISLEKY